MHDQKVSTVVVRLELNNLNTCPNLEGRGIEVSDTGLRYGSIMDKKVLSRCCVGSAFSLPQMIFYFTLSENMNRK